MTSPEPTRPSPWRPIIAWFDAYLATIATTGGVLTTLFVVPQTAAILSQAGFLDYAYDPTGSVLRSLALVATAVAVVVLVIVVIPPDRDHEAANPLRNSFVSRLQLWALARSEFASVLMLRVLGRFSKPGRRIIGLLLVALGAALSLVLDPAHLAAVAGRPDFASAWPSVVVAGLGAWAALVPDRCIDHPETFSWGWRVPARLLLVIGVLSAVGQLLWALPLWSGHRVPVLAYTLWGVGFLVFLAVVIGRLVDAASARTSLPVRGLAAFVGVALFSGFSADVIPRKPAAAPAAEASATAWYDAMQAQLAAMSPDGPVVLVAASGGGSRAALFAALTYQALDAARLNDDPASPTLGSQILLISSVSGGSLASAWYQRAVTVDGALPSRERPHNHDATVLAAALRAESTQLVAEARRRFGSDPERQDLVDNFVAIDEQLAAWPSQPLVEAPWLAQSAFVDDMGSDFMASVLRAVLEPSLSRGGAITRLWTSQFGLGELDNAPGPSRRGPLVLYNSTWVESGQRYVIGLPRLPSGLFGSAVGAMDDPRGARAVTSAEAARLSANFPFGFDVAHLPEVEGADTIELLDGGIVDNTGIDTFARLFERLSLVAGEGATRPAGVSDEESAKAKLLLETLRSRGVLLVEIDAGARPGEGGGAASLFAGLTRPLRALDAAGSNNAFSIRDNNVDRIRRVLDARAGGFLHLAWICNRIDNVPTAWSLGTRDEAVTTLQFLAEQHRLAPTLAALGAEFEDPTGTLQEQLDREALATREFQVAVASPVDVSESVRLASVSAVAERSAVGAARTTVPVAPPPTPKQVERAARKAEEALKAVTAAPAVVDEVGALLGAPGAAGPTVAAAKSVVDDAAKAMGADATKSLTKEAKKAGVDVKGATDAAEELLGIPLGAETKKKKKKSP